MTIREHIARIKNIFKITSADTIVTSRFIYLLMRKHRDFVIKRDKIQKLVLQDNLFQTIQFEELIEVDTVEACNIQTDCKIKRTKNKIPELIENDYGVIIRWVGSIDGITKVDYINSNAYQRKIKKKSAKYDTAKYFWYYNGHLYLPNVEWDAIKIEGFFEDDVTNSCEDCDENDTVNCKSKPDEVFRIPEYLVSSMDQLIFQDLSIHVQLQNDENNDNNENRKGL